MEDIVKAELKAIQKDEESYVTIQPMPKTQWDPPKAEKFGARRRIPTKNQLKSKRLKPYIGGQSTLVSKNSKDTIISLEKRIENLEKQLDNKEEGKSPENGSSLRYLNKSLKMNNQSQKESIRYV